MSEAAHLQLGVRREAPDDALAQLGNVTPQVCHKVGFAPCASAEAETPCPPLPQHCPLPAARRRRAAAPRPCARPLLRQLPPLWRRVAAPAAWPPRTRRMKTRGAPTAAAAPTFRSCVWSLRRPTMRARVCLQPPLHSNTPCVRVSRCVETHSAHCHSGGGKFSVVGARVRNGFFLATRGAAEPSVEKRE